MKNESAVQDAIKRLAKAASKSPRGTISLEGEEGLAASLEESEVGQARIVRIFREDTEIYWFFMVHRGEPKPQFYPVDVPFIPDSFCALFWNPKPGLSVMWTHGSGKDTEPVMADLAAKLEGIEIPDGVGEFMERAKNAGRGIATELGEGLRELLPRSFLERVSEIAEDILPAGIPEEAAEIARAASAFLEDQGWAPEADPETSRVSFSRVFERDGSRRHLKVWSFVGISTIGLFEKQVSD